MPISLKKSRGTETVDGETTSCSMLLSSNMEIHEMIEGEKGDPYACGNFWQFVLVVKVPARYGIRGFFGCFMVVVNVPMRYGVRRHMSLGSFYGIVRCLPIPHISTFYTSSLSRDTFPTSR